MPFKNKLYLSHINTNHTKNRTEGWNTSVVPETVEIHQTKQPSVWPLNGFEDEFPTDASKMDAPSFYINDI